MILRRVDPGHLLQSFLLSLFISLIFKTYLGKNLLIVQRMLRIAVHMSWLPATSEPLRRRMLPPDLRLVVVQAGIHVHYMLSLTVYPLRARRRWPFLELLLRRLRWLNKHLLIEVVIKEQFRIGAVDWELHFKL